MSFIGAESRSLDWRGVRRKKDGSLSGRSVLLSSFGSFTAGNFKFAVFEYLGVVIRVFNE